jgi:3-hydroxyisobutyrate dehydrogenase
MTAIAPGHTTIGWIGTGLMGQFMAGHLLDAGYGLVVHNRTRSKAERLIARGARWADSALLVADEADVVVTMVGLPSDVEASLLGPTGALARARGGQLFIDMSTSRPSLAVEIARSAEARGALGIDAPVSGGQAGARSATLSVMVGGAEDAVRAADPVYAQAAGLDLNRVLASVEKGAAGSWSLSNYAPRIIAGDFEPGFLVDHFLKDMAITLDEAKSLGIALPGLALVDQLYAAVRAQGFGKKGIQALALGLARLSAR